MLQTFEFKPAPIARAVRVEVDDIGATLRDSKGGVRDRLEFSSAQSARFADMSARGMTSRWFDVEHGRGRFRLKCNSSSADDPAEGHLAQYRAAVAAILAGLEARAPEVQVDLGVTDALRRTMFGFGLAAAAMGVGLPVAGVATGAETSKVLSGLVPSVFLLLIGGALIAAHRKPAQRPLMSLSALRKVLASE